MAGKAQAQAPSDSIDDAAATFTVVSLNLAHGRGSSAMQLGHEPAFYERNIEAAAAAARTHRSDVLALQEADGPSLWSGGFDHVVRLAARAEYPHVFHGLHFEMGLGPVRVAYGTAILARTALHHGLSHVFEQADPHTKGFTAARTTLGGRPVTVASVHLHSSSRPTRLEQARQLIRALNTLDTPLILAGDFNCTWEGQDDALRLVVEALALRVFQPESRELATFPSTRPRLRLDWILVSPELRFVNYRNWEERVSDHLAVEARLQWEAERDSG